MLYAIYTSPGSLWLNQRPIISMIRNYMKNVTWSHLRYRCSHSAFILSSHHKKKVKQQMKCHHRTKQTQGRQYLPKIVRPFDIARQHHIRSSRSRDWRKRSLLPFLMRIYLVQTDMDSPWLSLHKTECLDIDIGHIALSSVDMEGGTTCVVLLFVPVYAPASSLIMLLMMMSEKLVKYIELRGYNRR